MQGRCSCACALLITVLFTVTAACRDVSELMSYSLLDFLFALKVPSLL